MKNCSFTNALVLSATVLLFPSIARAQDNTVEAVPSGRFSAASIRADQQSNVPAPARQAEQTVERTVKRFRAGVEAGVGLDPELIMFGAHGTFGPIFTRGVDFRPGVEIGIGEVTTLFGINLDVLYTLPGADRPRGWAPYVGAGPNLALSHRGFETDADDLEDDTPNRFDFSDTDFEGGFNFIAGARKGNGMFLEMRATAYGVSNVRLLVGYTF